MNYFSKSYIGRLFRFKVVLISETFDFSKQVNNFIIKSENNADQIVFFYNEDNSDKERLILHRNILVDAMILLNNRLFNQKKF